MIPSFVAAGVLLPYCHDGREVAENKRHGTSRLAFLPYRSCWYSCELRILENVVINILRLVVETDGGDSPG
jgi:hypothetical protein